MRGLTPKQEKFCQEVAGGKNYSDAYRSAYDCSKMKDETVNNKAYILGKKGEIRARLEELQNKVQEATLLTIKDHVEMLAALRDEARASNQLSSAISAEIARGKAVGLYVEKKDITTNISLSPVGLESFYAEHQETDT